MGDDGRAGANLSSPTQPAALLPIAGSSPPGLPLGSVSCLICSTTHILPTVQPVNAISSWVYVLQPVVVSCAVFMWWKLLKEPAAKARAHRLPEISTFPLSSLCLLLRRGKSFGQKLVIPELTKPSGCDGPQSRGTLVRLLRTMSSQALSISRVGDSTTSLENLVQLSAIPPFFLFLSGILCISSHAS